MENLGRIIKQRREELGYTLKAISEKTRVPIVKLEAIENGDLKYFENDMSYVKFYVRYYCNALHLNFDDYKEELEAALEKFSNTTKMMKQIEFEEMNSRVKERKVNRSTSLKRKSKIDFSFLSFISIVVVLIAGLALVFFFMILPNLNNTVDPIITDDQRDVPGEIETHVDEVDETPINEDQVISIEKVGVSDYQIKNFTDNQEIQFEIDFLYNAYVSVQIDGVYSMNPASQLFSAGSTLDMKLNASNGQVVEFFVGYMDGSIIKLDGIELELDESIANRQGKVNFSFSFMGEE